MKRNDAEPIGKLIQQFLRQESLESPLNEQRLLDAWPQILGPAANYTSNLYIRNQTLYVHLTSAALRQELMMGREKLVRALNQKVGGRGFCLLPLFPVPGVFRLHGRNKTGFPDIDYCGHLLR